MSGNCHLARIQYTISMETELKNYRTTKDYGEILRLLQSAESTTGHFLWQNTPQGRVVLDLDSIEIDFVGRDLIITPKVKPIALVPKEPLYIKLQIRGAVFKLLKFDLSAKDIRGAFPTILKAEDLRREPRFLFTENDSKTVSLTLYESKMNQFQDLKFKLLDASKGGLGLKVSALNQHFFRRDKMVFISELDGQRLQQPVEAIVRYVEDNPRPWSHSQGGKSYRLGLQVPSGFNPDHLRIMGQLG